MFRNRQLFIRRQDEESALPARDIRSTCRRLARQSKKLEPLDKPGSNAGGIFADACISIGPSRAATIDIGQEK